MGNVFTPSFGTLPPVLVGRDDVLAGVGALFTRFSTDDPRWATHLRGHRSVGKTALLDRIQQAAMAAGWWVIQEDAGAGPPLTSRLITRALARIVDHDTQRKRRASQVSTPGVGLGPGPTPPRPASVTSVRDVLEAALSVEATGLLITIDEIHQAPDQMLAEIGDALEHLHRDGLPLVVVMAGLPRPDQSKHHGFLGRAWRPAFGRLSDRDVERCLVDTAATGGGAFEPRALRRALEMAAGEPYLLQLVGYHAWDTARRTPITVADVDAATTPARATYIRAVTAPMVAGVSPHQRAFLTSMVRHGTPTRLAAIRADHPWPASQAGTYRQRLVAAGLITPAGWGCVDFAVPGVPDLLADEC